MIDNDSNLFPPTFKPPSFAPSFSSGKSLAAHFRRAYSGDLLLISRDLGRNANCSASESEEEVTCDDESESEEEEGDSCDQSAKEAHDSELQQVPETRVRKKPTILSCSRLVKKPMTRQLRELRKSTRGRCKKPSSASFVSASRKRVTSCSARTGTCFATAAWTESQNSHMDRMRRPHAPTAECI